MRKQLILLALFLTGIWAAPAYSVCIQPTIWDGILKANVDKDGYVDYDAIRINKGGDLYEYIAYIETADLTKCSEHERLAFWLNAYNAHLVRLVLARPQMKSLNEDFALFGEQFKVAKMKLTLNEIEHRVIRSSPKKGGPIEGVSLKTFDPRIHFAINFGALGSPRLSNRAYTATALEAMLQTNATAFVNSTQYVRIEDGKLYVSSLFRWYAEDFIPVGGAGNYIMGLVDSNLRADAEDIKTLIQVDFPDNTQFRFDWTVNSKKNKVPAIPAVAQ